MLKQLVKIVLHIRGIQLPEIRYQLFESAGVYGTFRDA